MNPDDGFRRLNDPDEWNLTLRTRPDAFPARRKWAPWAVSLATIGAVAVVGVIVFSIFGLSVQNVRQPAVPALPSQSATPTPTPAPTITAGVGPTCQNLLNPETLAGYTSSGMVVTGDDYTQKVVEEGGNRIGMATFVKYGGIVCGWGSAQENALMYAFGPITADQAADAKTRIQSKGYTKVADSPYERYDNGSCETGQNCGGNSGYAFLDGYWAYFYNNGGGVVLDEVVTNGSNLAGIPVSAIIDPVVPPTATGTPATPATAPYLTSEGLGDLRIGKKVPSSSTFATYRKGGVCTAKAWNPSAKYEGGYDVITKDRSTSSPLVAIILRDDTIPTKSGVRVGDSLATLLATYPKFDETEPAGEFTLYVIKGTAGQVVFEVANVTATNGSYTADTVAAISVFDSSVDAGQSGNVFSTDAWSPCGVA